MHLGWKVVLWFSEVGPAPLIVGSFGPHFLKGASFGPFTCARVISVHCNLENSNFFGHTCPHRKLVDRGNGPAVHCL